MADKGGTEKGDQSMWKPFVSDEMWTAWEAYKAQRELWDKQAIKEFHLLKQEELDYVGQMLFHGARIMASAGQAVPVPYMRRILARRRSLQSKGGSACR